MLLQPVRRINGPIDRIVPSRPLHPFAEDMPLPLPNRPKPERPSADADDATYTPQGTRRASAPFKGALLDVRV